MNNLKKIATVTVATALVLASLSGCGKETESPAEQTEATATSTPSKTADEKIAEANEQLVEDLVEAVEDTVKVKTYEGDTMSSTAVENFVNFLEEHCTSPEDFESSIAEYAVHDYDDNIKQKETASYVWLMNVKFDDDGSAYFCEVRDKGKHHDDEENIDTANYSIAPSKLHLYDDGSEWSDRIYNGRDIVVVQELLEDKGYENVISDPNDYRATYNVGNAQITIDVCFNIRFDSREKDWR